MTRQQERRLALGLLAAFMVSQFVWPALPDWKQFAGWTVSLSAFCALLLGVVAAAHRKCREIVAVCALAGACQILSYGCSAAWLFAPWDTRAQDRCSAALNLPVGVIAALLGLVLAWWLYVGGRDG